MATVGYSSPMSRTYLEVKVAAAGLRHGVDAFAVLFVLSPPGQPAITSILSPPSTWPSSSAVWQELSRTEIVRGEDAPAFTESFELPLPMEQAKSPYALLPSPPGSTFTLSSGGSSGGNNGDNASSRSSVADSATRSSSPSSSRRPRSHKFLIGIFDASGSAADLANGSNGYNLSSAVYHSRPASSVPEDIQSAVPLGFATFSAGDLVRKADGTAELQLSALTMVTKRGLPALRHHGSASTTSWRGAGGGSTKSETFRSRRTGIISASTSRPPRSSIAGSTRKARHLPVASPILVLSGERVTPQRPSHMYTINLSLAPFSQAWGAESDEKALIGAKLGGTAAFSSSSPKASVKPQSRGSKRSLRSGATGSFRSAQGVRRRSTFRSSEVMEDRAKSLAVRPPEVFFVLYRALRGASDTIYTPVYRSECVDAYGGRFEKVQFRPAIIRSERLHGDDEHRALRIEFFHVGCGRTKAGLARDVPIGFVQLSASSFQYACPGGALIVTPNHGIDLVAGKVNVDDTSMLRRTRRGTLTSSFSLSAGPFIWGAQKALEARQTERFIAIDKAGRGFVRSGRRADGGKVKPIPSQGLLGAVPRGVSYMSLRASREGSSNSDRSDIS